MAGLEGVSLMVVVMDRGLLGLLLCLVVMCVAGAVGASIRLVFLVLSLLFFVFVAFCLLYGIGLFDFCCLLLLCLMVTCASLGLFSVDQVGILFTFIYLAVWFVVFCPLFDK